MTALRQPYRAVLAATELAARARLLPGPARAVARPVSARQANRPPWWMSKRGDPGVRVRDELVPARGGPVRVRVHVPAGHPGGGPAVLYLHGGGFVYGGLDGADYLTRGLTARTGFVVVSVEYRLAPECSFPGPLEDCEDALHWLVQTRPEGIDASRVAIAGDSAGGNLAAALALLVRDTGGPALSHQSLVYPFTDTSITSPSWREHAGGGVDVAAGEQMVRWYCGDTPYDHPLVHVLGAPDLTGLPPALVLTAGHDVLHLDGVRYAERLQEAGVPVLHRHFPALPHGFLSMSRLSRDADDALDLVAAEQRAALLGATR